MSRLWVIAQMALARRHLRQQRGLLFWKLCGTGTGQGFTLRPDGRVWAILAAWPSESVARAALADARVWRGWRARARESWTLILNPTSSRGSWAGVNPFLPDSTPTPVPSQLYAVLTRATLRPLHLLAFWRRVPDVSARIGADPNVAFKIGIGEVPLLHQVTFSVWPDLASMSAFARNDGAHAEAIRAVREGDWFAEELYARFQVLGSLGSWEGRDPLSPLDLKGPDLRRNAA
jgi:spheroidene monooxygenase